MNRAARRANKKATPSYLRNMTPDQIKKRFVQQGISPDDLIEEYRKGYNAGWRDAGDPIVKGCYAAICLALNEMHGFGCKRCKDVLNKVDEILLYTLTSDEAIQSVWDKIGLKLTFSETFDRVSEVK